MKIHLILVEIRRDIPTFSGNYYEGVASVVSSIKAAGHTVTFTHLTKPPSKEAVIETLNSTRPGMLAFSSMTNGFFYVKQIAAWCKEVFDIPVICGGIHATLAPEEVIGVRDIDFVCVGEGERAVVELLRGLETGGDIGNISNIWLKKDGKIIRNPVRPTVEELDQYPPPDRDIFDFPNLMSTREALATFLAGRGCPFNCAYCANHALRDKYPNKGGYIRFKSVERIIGEIKGVLKKHPQIKYVAFSDDILPLRMEWLREFTARYKKEIGLPFRCNINPTLVKEEAVTLLKDAGCTMIELGIESGNEHIRRTVLNRRMTDEQIIKAAELVRKNGMKLATYNMVGIPGESLREIKDTITLNGLISPVKVYSFIFYPYPGTKLYELCREEGLLTENRFDTYAEGSILKSRFLSNKELLFAHRFFRTFIRLYSSANSMPRPLGRALSRALDSIILARLPYGFLIRLHSVIYRSAAFFYMTFGRYIYNRQKAYYS